MLIDVSAQVIIEFKYFSFRQIDFLDQTIHFVWQKDHNVNYLGKGETARTLWASCNITAAEAANISVQIPPQLDQTNFKMEMTELGWHYFYCGVKKKQNGIGKHCQHGVKAAVQVVNDFPNDCTMHVH